MTSQTTRRTNLIGLTLMLLIFASVMFKDKITTFYRTELVTYTVTQVANDLRDFERLPVFSITGLALEGNSLLSIFPLEDTQTGLKIYIIPKGTVLPNANQVQTFTVKISRQIKWSPIGLNMIILEEV